MTEQYSAGAMRAIDRLYGADLTLANRIPRAAIISSETGDLALIEALEQACVELEECANILDGQRLGGTASLMRVAVNRHRAALAAARKEG